MIATTCCGNVHKLFISSPLPKVLLSLPFIAVRSNKGPLGFGSSQLRTLQSVSRLYLIIDPSKFQSMPSSDPPKRHSGQVGPSQVYSDLFFYQMELLHLANINAQTLEHVPPRAAKRKGEEVPANAPQIEDQKSGVAI